MKKRLAKHISPILNPKKLISQHKSLPSLTHVFDEVAHIHQTQTPFLWHIPVFGQLCSLSLLFLLCISLFSKSHFLSVPPFSFYPFFLFSLSLFLYFVIDSLHDGIGIPWQLLRGIATFSFIRQCLIAACIKLSVYFLCRYDIWFVTMLVSFSGCWWSTYNSSSFEHEVFTAPLW
jgi:hypothetical protein